MTDGRRTFDIGLVLLILDAGLFAMSQSYGGAIGLGGNPMPPELYGEAMAIMPPIAWVAVQAWGALLGVFGALLMLADGRWSKLGLIGAGAGNTVLAVMFAFMAYSAWWAPAGILIKSMSLYCGLIYTACAAVASGRLLIWGE